MNFLLVKDLRVIAVKQFRKYSFFKLYTCYLATVA